jgi:polyphosphate glucokinase
MRSLNLTSHESCLDAVSGPRVYIAMAKAPDSGENPRMRAKKKAPRRILVLDVGGSHVKLRVGSRGKTRKFVSGPDMSAADMVKGVGKLVVPTEYDAVSIGYPGVVVRGRIVADPHNLGHGWVGFDFEGAFGKPVRILNDAAMQAVGSYSGGRMLFLGLGTGLGATLILDGLVEPMELGHMPYKHGRSYEDYVGAAGLKRLGAKKWRKLVDSVVEQFKNALEVDYVVLGGGNADRLKVIPKDVRLGDNSNAMTGGQAIWRDGDTPLKLSSLFPPRAAASQK